MTVPWFLCQGSQTHPFWGLGPPESRGCSPARLLQAVLPQALAKAGSFFPLGSSRTEATTKIKIKLAKNPNPNISNLLILLG